MSQKEIEQIVELVLLKSQDSANRAANNTVSKLFHDLSRKLDLHIETHEKDTRMINEKLDPVYEAFRNVTGFKRTVLVAGTLIGGLWAAVEGWKRLIGK